MHDNPVVPLLLAISLILCAARLAGAAARRLGQPRVLGELLIGVALGPTLVNLLHWGPLAAGHLDATIKELAELGVLVLMFNIALEIQPREERGSRANAGNVGRTVAERLLERGGRALLKG